MHRDGDETPGHAPLPVRQARCSCGQLSLTCEGEPVRISMCHCHACQRRTGSAFGAQAWFARACVRTGSSDERRFERVGESGGRLTFLFCPACGSTVWWESEARPEVIAVALGAFAGSGFPPPGFSVWEQRRLPWVDVPAMTQRSD